MEMGANAEAQLGIGYKSKLLSILLFALSLLVGGHLVQTYDELWYKQQSLFLTQLVSQQSNLIQRRLERSLAATYILATILKRNQGEIKNFGPLADDIIASLGGLTNLQLAPGGIVRQIYPLAGNERAIGHNLLRDDNRRNEALLAIEQRKLTLAGPFELVQGGVAIVGRNPVFIKDSSGNEEFWGFTSALILIDDLLKFTALNELKKNGFHYQLTARQPVSGNITQVIGEKLLDTYISTSLNIDVPNSHWTLKIGKDYPSRKNELNLQYSMVFLVSFLMALLLFLILRQPAKLKRMVAEQTKELEKLAYYDPLTRLGNRKLLMKIIPDVVKNCSLNSQVGALIYLGIDDFKRVNDSMGHSAGDELLKETASRLSNCTRYNDKVVRTSGDEFAVVLTRLRHSDDIKITATKILNAITETVTINQHQLNFSISIGIAILPTDGENAEQLLKHASLAMRHAKKRGKNRFYFYENEMEKSAKANLEVELELKRAIKENEFELYFQPIMVLSNLRPKSFEALIRWRHPTQGLVFPDTFIPVAEQSGLIIELGYWVLKASCLALKKFPKQVSVSVNVSARQFMDPALAEKIKAILRESDTPPQRIILEITESLLIENLESVLFTLKDLRDFGLEISVDDFGTGHSSLSKLKLLPITTLKIDREFIRDLPDNQDDRELTEAIIHMAKKLKLKVVAEGIETQAQQEFLQKQECEYGQGYHFSKPVPIAQALEFTKDYF